MRKLLLRDFLFQHIEELKVKGTTGDSSNQWLERSITVENNEGN